MAIQHTFTFKSNEYAKVFQERIHKYLKDVVSYINDNVVIVIDGRRPPQSFEIERLANHSTGSFKKATL